MALNESQTQKLIGLYRSCECLWNPQSPGYLSSSEQEDAWRKITRGMNSGLTPDQVKLQVLALRNYYDAECAVIRKSKLEGYSHKPRHTYFNDLLFLGNVLSEETMESKAGILEDSLLRDDHKPCNYPHNFSKATFSQCTDSLCNNDTKPEYTYYKLILEPENPSISRKTENGAVRAENVERSASGNDTPRFYPTAYCVPCKKKKPSCKPRCQCTDTDSSSSTECCGPRRAMNLNAHKCCSYMSVCVSQAPSQTSGCCCPPVRSRYTEPGPKLCCQPRPRYVPRCHPPDTGRDRSCCVSNWKRNKNAVYRRLRAELEAQEAREKLCQRTRERPRVKLPPPEDRNSERCYKSQECLNRQISKCCCKSGECLQIQLSPQEGRNPACCSNSHAQLKSNASRNSSCCCNSNERRQSGADQINVCSQPGVPQNSCQLPNSLNGMNNNQQDLDYGRYTADYRTGPEPCNYCHGPQIPESNIYINNQPMQNPGSCTNDPQGQQIYSNGMCFQMQTPKTAYYQPQPAQQYVNTNYAPFQPGIDYGRSPISDQSNSYGYAVESCNCQPQAATPVPAQRPLTVCPLSQDVQICHANYQYPCQPPCNLSCQAHCALSSLPDPNNRCPADTTRYTEQSPVIETTNGQQEDCDTRICANKRDRQWQSDDVLRNSPTRRCSQNQGRCSDAEQDTQKQLVCRKVDRRRSINCDQDGDQKKPGCRKVDRVDYVTKIRSTEYTVRSSGLHDETSNRRASCNNGTERNYEECPSPPRRRQYMAEKDVCSTDCNYEKCPSQKRRKCDDYDNYPETSTRMNPERQEPRRTDQAICSRKPPLEFRKKSMRKEYVECTNPNCPPSKLPTKNYNCAQEPKEFPQPPDDSLYVPCPSFRQVPKKSLCHSRPDQIWKDREDRIAGRTRPPPRRCGYQDDKKPTTTNQCRPPPEEIECECESEVETIPPKRRIRDNRPKRPCDGKEDTKKIGRGRREVFETCCTHASSCTEVTCPNLPRRPHSQEPCATPRRRPTKCYDDEIEATTDRNQSPARMIPRPRNDITDGERPMKDCTTVQRLKKKKAPTDDCECSSDDNTYDQGRYRDYDQYCDSPRETFKRGPRKTDRNECCKNNARSQRGSPDIDDDYDYDTDDYCPKRSRKKMNDYLDDCGCSSDSDECTRYKKRKSPGGSRRRGESPRNCQNYRDFDFNRPTSKTTSPCRQPRRTEVYESEYDCPSYTPKRYDMKPCPRKQEYKSEKPDLYDSVYECFCSTDDRKPRIERKPSPCSTRPRRKNCQRDQKNDTSWVCCRLEKTGCRRKPICAQNKNEENNCMKDAYSDENESEFECECKCNEENNKAQDVCLCNCGQHSNPLKKLTQSPKRNPAGDGTPCDNSVGIETAPKYASESASTSRQASFNFNLDLPFTEETKTVQVPECSVPLPIKKKKARPGSAGPSKNLKSSKPKPITASPTRNLAPPKTQPGETAKKRTTSLSNGKRNAQSGAKRTTDQRPSAAVNSKLPNDLNTASYFICKLQDDDNSQQYLIVVPKEPVARRDTHRDDPGQGPWKQLHCQRQISGFQSVSWSNPESNSVFPSPPFHPIEGSSERRSYAMPPGMTDTTMRIVKEYLHQTMKASSPGLMQSFQPAISPRRMLKSVLARPIRCHPVDRPPSKANVAILSENGTKNSLQNFSSVEDKNEVIVLLPPVVGFRPSKNSFSTGAVEVQRITVRNSGTDVKPRTTPTKTVAPRPPAKPKRKALL